MQMLFNCDAKVDNPESPDFSRQHNRLSIMVITKYLQTIVRTIRRQFPDNFCLHAGKHAGKQRIAVMLPDDVNRFS